MYLPQRTGADLEGRLPSFLTPARENVYSLCAHSALALMDIKASLRSWTMPLPTLRYPKTKKSIVLCFSHFIVENSDLSCPLAKICTVVGTTLCSRPFESFLLFSFQKKIKLFHVGTHNNVLTPLARTDFS